MRLRVCIAVAPLLVALASPAGASANPQHAGIQVALRALGLYCGPIDGEVGPMTVAGIRAVQVRAHLPATGVIDVRTRIALGPLGRPLFGSRNLHAADFGLDVSVLQYILARRGLYQGALDGYMGPATVAALRRYQRSMQLAVDGVVGPRTLSSIVTRDRVAVRGKPAVVRVRIERVAATFYVVRPGDNLTVLARRFGTTVAALARANRLDPRKPLLIGTRLKVAPPRARANVSLAPTAVGVRATLDAWSARLGVSASLVRALAWMESGYQTRIVSSAGATGVLQTLPSTRDFVEEVLVGRALPRTLDGDVQVGVLYLRHLLRQFKGDERLALAAWYQGEAAVRKHGLYDVTKPFVANVLALKSRV